MKKAYVNTVVCPFCLCDVVCVTSPAPGDLIDRHRLVQYVEAQLVHSGHFDWHVEQMAAAS